MNNQFPLGDERRSSPEEVIPLQICDGRGGGLRVGATVHAGIGSRLGAGIFYSRLLWSLRPCVMVSVVLVVYVLVMLVLSGCKFISWPL